MKSGKLIGKILGIAIAVVLVGAMLPLGAFVSNSQVEASPGIIYVPDAYSTIQAAVNAADSGDTIIVRDGTYAENVNVNKDHLTIQSENGAGLTIVQAANPSGDVFAVTADYVNISAFTAKGGHIGIHVNDAQGCVISENLCTDNYWGIWLDSCQDITLTHNFIYDSTDWGVYLSFSSGNIIAENDSSMNGAANIYFHYSDDNVVQGNNCQLSPWNGIRLYYCTNNTLNDNTFSDNDRNGIDLDYSTQNILMGNACCGNGYNGIYVFYSTSNCIRNNTCIGNDQRGIRVRGSSDNSIYLNDFIDNAANVYSEASTNTWNSPEPITYTYNGYTYTSYLGNHWSDYAGSDVNGDGVGEMPYPIYSDADDYPLVAPFENYGIGLMGKIAFVHDVYPGNSEIYVMNADGTNQIQLTDSPQNDYHPAWSPDGTKIAFCSPRDGDWEIYAMHADGSNQTRVTNNPAVDANPSWSPDGTKIAFNSHRDGDWEIYVMTPDGSNQTRLTNNAADDVHPSWSPDGTKIAFQSDRDGNREIYVMNAGGGGEERVTYNSACDEEPAWSPDGNRIAFESDRDGNYEIYAMNADGSKQTRLTTNPAWDYGPTWSPDSTKIAFTSLRDSNREIYAMNADGSGQTRLTENAVSDFSPAWSPVSNGIPPTVSNTSPEDGATAVTVVSTVTATFSEAMDSSTITTDSFTLTGSAVSGTVTYDPETYTATFTPDADLEYDHTYTATLSTAITGLAGNPLTEPHSWQFTTESAPGDTTPPEISNVQVSKIGTNTATITWSTNEPATSEVNYGTTTPPSSTVSSSELVSTHELVLTGLNAGTVYFFEVKSADEAENTAIDNNGGNYYSFTTPDKLLPVPYMYQGNTDWCYLYSLAMVLQYYGCNIHAYEIANDWGLGNGEGAGTLLSVVTGYTEKYVEKTLKLKLEVSYDLGGALSFDVYKNHIDQNVPLIVVDTLATGHAGIVVGYETGPSADDRYLYLHDPSGAWVGADGLKWNPSASHPLMYVRVPWKTFRDALFWSTAYLVIIDGSPNYPSGVMYLGDLMAPNEDRVYHAAEDSSAGDGNRGELYLSNELDWVRYNHLGGGQEILAGNEYLNAAAIITNHTEENRSYRFVVRMEDSKSGDACGIYDIGPIEVPKFSKSPVSIRIPSFTLSEIGPGEYTLYLDLYGSNGDLYDNIGPLPMRIASTGVSNRNVRVQIENDFIGDDISFYVYMYAYSHQYDDDKWYWTFYADPFTDLGNYHLDWSVEFQLIVYDQHGKRLYKSKWLSTDTDGDGVYGDCGPLGGSTQFVQSQVYGNRKTDSLVFKTIWRDKYQKWWLTSEEIECLTLLLP